MFSDTRAQQTNSAIFRTKCEENQNWRLKHGQWHDFK